MSNPNNDDYLSRIQHTVCGYLEASTYINAAPAIPVISGVKGDIIAAIKAHHMAPVRITVGLGDITFTKGGGVMALQSLRLIVRCLEIVPVNRGAGGMGDSALRVAQKVASILNTKVAALASDGETKLGGTIEFDSIEEGATDDGIANQNAWHVNFNVTGGGLLDFDRQNAPPAPGSP